MARKSYNVAEATGVSVVLGRSSILDDICLSISKGETVALLGPNGAGKSTFLRCLAGAVRPTSGTVVWFARSNRPAVVVRRQLGYVGHETGLYAELSAVENLVFAARMYGVKEPQQRAYAVLADAGLERIAYCSVNKLSQGLRRRLAVARALVPDPPLILLDEPFAGLDVQGQAWLERLFHQWRGAQRTVCFASHDLEQSRRLADRIVWLEAGHVAKIERISTVHSPQVRSA